MLRVLELFAGIGACSKALERLGIEHEIVDAVEIDKYAVQSFNAVHGTNFEPQDITKWDKGIQVDLIMHGSPCQDFSVAGRGAGGDKDSGTRSSLMYETLRIVEKLKPKYVIWENVKNLLSKKHRHNFDAYIEAMNELGYVSKYQVLNAKDYGVPQNRERVFTVSILDGGRFTFPESMPLTKKLADVLEDEVDEKYYLSSEQVARIVVPTESQKTSHREPKIVARTDTHQKGGVYSAELVSPTITATTYKQPTQIAEPRTTRGRVIASTIRASIHKQGARNLIENVNSGRGYEGVVEPKIIASRGRGENNEQHLEARKDGLTNTITSVAKDNYVAEPAGGGLCIRTANKKGYDMATNGDAVDLAYPNSNTRRGRVGHGASKTLATGDTMGTVQDFRIRKLTPKECWRLMGFDDEDFEKAKASGVSNSQLYKQAGNSIVVNVLEGILRNLIKKGGTN